MHSQKTLCWLIFLLPPFQPHGHVRAMPGCDGWRNAGALLVPKRKQTLRLQRKSGLGKKLKQNKKLL